MAEQVLEQRAAYLIGLIANSVVNASAALCRRRSGIGFTEWRSMVVLALEPATAKRICEITAIDKAAISRSLHSLEQQGLVRPSQETAARRSRAYLLTDTGRTVYEALLPAARELEGRLLSSLDAEEAPVLLRLLRKLKGGLPAIGAA
jgi:DNA-binding MarR family transcriptional regulator